MAVRIVQFDDPVWHEPGAVVPAEIQALVGKHYVPPAGKLLLAYDPETPEKIIGMAGLRRVSEHVCEAANVVVFWGYQNRGIGRLLMEAIFREAAAGGFRGIRAEVPEEIGALVRFFEKAGFMRSPAAVQQAGRVRFEKVIPEGAGR